LKKNEAADAGPELVEGNADKIKAKTLATQRMKPRTDLPLISPWTLCPLWLDFKIFMP
jgi:hypothetical protein